MQLRRSFSICHHQTHSLTVKTGAKHSNFDISTSHEPSLLFRVPANCATIPSICHRLLYRQCQHVSRQRNIKFLILGVHDRMASSFIISPCVNAFRFFPFMLSDSQDTHAHSNFKISKSCEMPPNRFTLSEIAYTKLKKEWYMLYSLHGHLLSVTRPILKLWSSSSRDLIYLSMSI